MLSALLAAGMSEGVYVLYWVVVIACLIIIFLLAVLCIIMIMCQKSNSDGITGVTTASDTYFGKNRGTSMESKLKKWTWIALAVMAVLAIVVYVVQLIAP
ncbi:MAG: preprotein translocase subunit SecG [Clostridia bacterium]|nr:preprotein translocase subunit SecG [Clostridia bacterium]